MKNETIDRKSKTEIVESDSLWRSIWKSMINTLSKLCLKIIKFFPGLHKIMSLRHTINEFRHLLSEKISVLLEEDKWPWNSEPKVERDNVELKPITFHEKHGQNIRLWVNKEIAMRAYDFCKGLVFLPKPISTHEFIVVQILETDECHLGSLAFGVTTEDPNEIRIDSLPDNLRLIDDEYTYHVRTNVIKSSKVGDILIFYLNEKNEIKMKVNEESEQSLFSIKGDNPHWCFFDLYGSTRKIRAYLAEKSDVDLLGEKVRDFIHQKTPSNNNHEPDISENNSPTVSNSDSDSSSQKTPSNNNHEPDISENNSPTVSNSDSDSSSQNPILTLDCYVTNNKIWYKPVSTSLLRKCERNSNFNDSPINEDPSIGFCIECFKNQLGECMLYPCGDFVLCYGCAEKLQRDSKDARCPKCISPIKNVVRVYRP